MTRDVDIVSIAGGLPDEGRTRMACREVRRPLSWMATMASAGRPRVVFATDDRHRLTTDEAPKFTVPGPLAALLWGLSTTEAEP